MPTAKPEQSANPLPSVACTTALPGMAAAPIVVDSSPDPTPSSSQQARDAHTFVFDCDDTRPAPKSTPTAWTKVSRRRNTPSAPAPACHDRPKNFIFPGPSGGTALVPYPTVAPTTPGILAPKNSITTSGAQPTRASPTPAPLSPIKEQPTFAIAAPQPSRLIIPPDVQHSIRNPSSLYMDQYMSSPSPPIPDQAVFLGGDDDCNTAAGVF